MVLTCFEASRFLRQSKSGGFWLIEFDRGPFGGPLSVELEIIFEFVLGGGEFEWPHFVAHTTVVLFEPPSYRIQK